MNKKGKAMRIVIYVSGGLVQDVLADAPGVQAMIVDYDNEREGGEPKSIRSFEEVAVNTAYIAKTVKGIED